MRRLTGVKGYELEFLPKLNNYRASKPAESAIIINNWIEQSISKNTDQYMWVNRRFKTRPPENAKSLY